MRRHLTPEQRAAVVEDYRSGTDGIRTVAARHGVSPTALHSWVTPPKPRVRKPDHLREEFALTGGRWVRQGLVHRWIPDDYQDKDDAA